jgi:transposase-like protein
MERTLSLNAVAKRYDEAFKRQAVEMVLQGSKTVREVAENLGVSISSEKTATEDLAAVSAGARPTLLV